MNKAYNYCIRLLSKKEYSTESLRKKLIERKHLDGEIETVLKDLQEKNYLSDERYKEAKTRYYIKRGYGLTYINAQLKQDHLFLEESEYDRIVQEVKVDPFKISVDKAINKYQREEDPFKRKMKINNYLQRRGFSSSDIQSFRETN